jgi:hypothetical protein
MANNVPVRFLVTRLDGRNFIMNFGPSSLTGTCLEEHKAIGMYM